MLKENIKNNLLFHLLTLCLLYFAAGKVSLGFAFLNSSTSAVWIPTAISITSFIYFGYRIWPAIFVGAFFVNLTTTGTILTSGIIASGNTLEGIAALFFIEKFLDKRRLFTSPVALIKYSVLVGVICTAISAVTGVSVLTAYDMIKPGQYSLVFLSWWIGDMGSAIVLASIILLWKDEEIKWSVNKILESAVVSILLIITTIIIFVPGIIHLDLPMILNRYPFPLLTFPIFLYISFRFGLRETALSIFLFFSIAVAGISGGSARMSVGNPETSFINLQIFTMIIFLLKMSVGIAVNQRRNIEKNLQLSEEKFRGLAETANDAIITIDTQSKILFCNKSVERIFGYQSSELLGKDIWVLVPERLKKEYINTMQEYLLNGQAIRSSFETFAWHKRDFEVPVELSFSEIVRNGQRYFTGIIRDITDRKNAHQKMEQALKEKEVLLREIHHRVKNNLQIISSLLNLQSANVTDKEASQILKISRDRVKSMALIHEKLYRSDAVANINIRDYLLELISYLYASYDINKNDVALKIDVTDVSLDLKTLIPVSLIVNELVSNALKHGFPQSRDKAEINIQLEIKNEQCTLEISNNGVEFPREIDFKNTDSLGLQLVNTLTEQINGSIKLERNGKTKFILDFNR